MKQTENLLKFNLFDFDESVVFCYFKVYGRFSSVVFKVFNQVTLKYCCLEVFSHDCVLKLKSKVDIYPL